MAAAYTCDGCAKEVEKPVQLGHVLKRDYCDECAKNAQMFLQAEEDNRKHFHHRFAEIRQQLITVHSKDGAFKLPDVP